MRHLHPLSTLTLVLALAPLAAQAQMTINIGAPVSGIAIGAAIPGISIGIDLPTYPQLVPVPGYPVYYAPGATANLFFYDGQYWAYQGDNWYASTWYNGPWQAVSPYAVPLFILRVPVRYYNLPPPYFHAWAATQAPRWGDHWGPQWSHQHANWNHWDHAHVPYRAPLPAYQAAYPRDRYPHSQAEMQTLHTQHYAYTPHATPRAQPRAEAADAQRQAPERHSQAQPEKHAQAQPEKHAQAHPEKHAPAQPANHGPEKHEQEKRENR